METKREPRIEPVLDCLTSAAVLAWVAPATLELGRALVNQGRVAKPKIAHSQIEAVVGDEKLGRVRVTLRRGVRGLAGECTCGAARRSPCAHLAAVAQLIVGDAAHASDLDVVHGEGSRVSGIDAERRTRVQRGSSELFDVQRHPSTRIYGRYDVGSPSARRYQVDLRALDAWQNGCSCPDFDTNGLGTCKHIEAALHWCRKHSKAAFSRASGLGPPASFLYVGHEPGPHVCARLGANATPAERRCVARWFGVDGRSKRPLAECWDDLEQDAIRANLTVPPEVSRLAARSIERIDGARRQKAIDARVRAAGNDQPGFGTRLYQYQVEGVAFLASRRRALLADDMGLGKTAQAIAAMMWLRRHEGIRKTVIVCPASLKHQWQNEILRFTDVDPKRVVVVNGTRELRAEVYASDADILVTSYELVRADERDLIEVAPDLLVLDEAQRIKNWRTRTADAVKHIPNRFAFVLTGTPLENRLDDLYSLLQVVDPHILGPLWRFNEAFTKLDGRGKVLGYRHLDALRERVAPVMLRRRKEEVLDQLPAQVVNRLMIEMTPAQIDLHEDAKKTVGVLLSRLKRRPLTPAEEKQLMRALQRMRLACNAAGLLDPSIAGSPKLEELERLLDELCVDGEHKVVVFSEWEKFQEMAAAVCKKLKLGHVRLHGGVPSGSRGALIERFRSDPDCKVFLSTDAGGTGLNLQFASHVINLDLPWNPAVLAQRVARIHRIGQRGVANVILLVSKDSFEERLEGTLAAKRALFAAAVGDDQETTEIDRSTLATRIATILGDAFAASTAPTPTVEQVVPIDDSVSALRAALGDSLERVVRLADGRVLGVVRGNVPTGLEVPGLLVSEQTARALEPLGDASPLAAGEVLFRAEPSAAVEPQFEARRARALEAARKLAGARALVQAGIGAEALGLLHGALALACRAMDDRGDPGEAPTAILASVFEHCVPNGTLGDADANALTRAGELARAFASTALQPPASLVAKIAAEATDLVARANAAVQAGGPARRSAGSGDAAAASTRG